MPIPDWGQWLDPARRICVRSAPSLGPVYPLHLPCLRWPHRPLLPALSHPAFLPALSYLPRSFHCRRWRSRKRWRLGTALHPNSAHRFHLPLDSPVHPDAVQLLPHLLHLHTESTMAILYHPLTLHPTILNSPNSPSHPKWIKVNTYRIMNCRGE